jgi:putative Holliday junction resolvase
MRYLGVDFGERRIGLAISDADGRVATPLRTLHRASDRTALAELVAVAASEDVEAFVVGEPVNLDGSRGPAAERARRFSARLARLSGLPCQLVNESLTTVEAAARLREAGVDARRDPERLDAIAAQVLLQEALDRGLSTDRRHPRHQRHQKDEQEHRP